MKHMHDFKTAQSEKCTFVDDQPEATVGSLLAFLCRLREWAQTDPYIQMILEDDDCLYLLYRDISFTEQDYWQNFRDDLSLLHKEWTICAFSADLYSQESVELILTKKEAQYYCEENTVSGNYAETLRSLCLQIKGKMQEQTKRVYTLCQHMDWKQGVLIVPWKQRSLLEEEKIPWLDVNTGYCYSVFSEEETEMQCLDALCFVQKVKLWTDFFRDGLDYIEFAWLYDRMMHQSLYSRVEWEMSLYTALKQLSYNLKISDHTFELYNGQGQRLYFSFDNRHMAQRAFLKLLFPLAF